MKLYKYYAVNELNLVALINEQFWASKPDSFNDPYDTPVKWIKKQGGIAMSAERKHDQWLPIAGSQRQLPPTPFDEEEIEKVMNMGIVCFSETCESILLWSHYADQHKGYVLEFDLPDDSIEFGMFPRLIKVKYDGQENVAVSMNRYVDVARYKEKHWEYEKEVRFVVDKGNQLCDWFGLKKDWFNKPSGIIFGARANNENIKALTKIAKRINPKVTIKKSELSDEVFSLKISSINLQ